MYCGDAPQLSSLDASITIAESQTGGEVYFTDTAVSFTSGTPAYLGHSKNVCYSGSFDSVAYYRALGYTCQ